MNPTTSTPQVPRTLHVAYKLMVVLFAVLASVAGFIGYSAYRNHRSAVDTPQVLGGITQADIVSSVGRLIALPTDESPEIAEITDSTKLPGEKFFQAAKNGDILLTYPRAGRAILYRRSADRIVDATQFSLAPAAESAAQTESPNAAGGEVRSLTVAYYNGTGVSGRARQTESRLRQQFKNLKTVVVTNASRSDYKETMVVDLSGAWPEEASQIADALGGAVGSLPKGETRPNADILVLIGE